VSHLGLGTFKSRTRLEFLLKVSVSEGQCLVSKILAETPALLEIYFRNSLYNGFVPGRQNRYSETRAESPKLGDFIYLFFSKNNLFLGIILFKIFWKSYF